MLMVRGLWSDLVSKPWVLPKLLHSFVKPLTVLAVFHKGVGGYMQTAQ